MDESLSTLRFAVQAKQLRTCARVNAVMDPKDAEIAQLQRQLEAKAEAERRWRLKFHRLSRQVHPNSAEEEGEEEERVEAVGSQAEAANRSSLSSTTAPLASLAEEDGTEGEEGMEEREERERRLRSKVTELYQQLQQQLRPLALSREQRPADPTSTEAESQAEPTAVPVSPPSPPFDVEALVDHCRSVTTGAVCPLTPYELRLLS